MKKGTKHTQGSKDKISQNNARYWFGKARPPLSQEHRKKLSLAKVGKASNAKGKHWKMPEEAKKKISLAQKGRKLSEESKRKMSIAKSGVLMPQISGLKNYRWKGGYENTLMLNRKRRILKMGIAGSHTLDEWETLKAQYNWTCPACKRQEPKIRLSEDHIIPISKGGSNNIENIQPLCRSCNSKKRVQIIKY